MTNMNEIYEIDLDKLFHITGGDRILPYIDSGVQQWWRYLGDTPLGEWCLYSAQYSHLTGMPTEDDHFYNLITNTDLEPCILDGGKARVINITDRGDYILESVDDSSNFILTREEFEACGILI